MSSTTTTEAQADNMNVNALDSMQELPPPPPPNWQYNMPLFALNAQGEELFSSLEVQNPSPPSNSVLSDLPLERTTPPNETISDNIAEVEEQEQDDDDDDDDDGVVSSDYMDMDYDPRFSGHCNRFHGGSDTHHVDFMTMDPRFSAHRNRFHGGSYTRHVDFMTMEDSDDDDDDDDDDEEGVRPASEESKMGLEVVKIEKGMVGLAGEVCAVCLDEFCVESEARKMPCSHTYHQKCIIKWLGKSNMCPMCRYRVP
uniref:RING-type E3 ubiquitin transferase n=1 Tax=Quercus lobata TaxID=97700 RepID=A0A7N2N3V5_QUELO